MARPPKGRAHVDRIDVDPDARQRLTWILATLSGDATVADACEALGIGESRFHEIRERALAGAAAALVRGRPGRPPKREEEAPEEVAWLEARVAELEDDVAIERARAEIAIGMPDLLRPRRRGEKTDRPRRGGGALRAPDTSFLAPKPPGGEGGAGGRDPEEPGP